MRKYLPYHLFCLMLLTSIQIVWAYFYYPEYPATIMYSLLIVVSIFILITVILPPPKTRVLQSQISRIFSLIPTLYGLAFFLIMFTRLEYSRSILLSGGGLTTLWFVTFYYWQENRIKTTLFSLGTLWINKPSDRISPIKYIPINENHLIAELKSGIAVNLHAPLSLEEEKLIADCALAKIPVYHSGVLKERYTGKVSSLHLSELSLASLQPDPIYQHFKNIFDKTIILIFSPAILLIALFIAIALKTSRSDSVIFKQSRVGHHNKKFVIYKFRTMKATKNESENRFAHTETNRISKLGYFLRRTRLDELPQFWNILKGDMAIIGPRPEQPHFAKEFENKIPFYNYRHIVKPGLTGWAQVNQGYTSDLDSTEEKLSYDLYYLKHISFNLDMKICLKTINVMFTGKGAL
ncbi:sugar transferase [Vibrio aestuarianus]|nr:sugar transferase [Vibrio aestuarianus]